MNETFIVLLAASIATFMVIIVRIGVSPNLRSAIRTTLVVFVGWGTAISRHGMMNWANLSWQVQGMLLISILAILLAWLCYFRAIQTNPSTSVPEIDRVNVGLATLFAVLYLSKYSDLPQSFLVACLLISSALVLALARR